MAISRRQLLRSTTAAAATLVLPSLALARGSQRLFVGARSNASGDRHEAAVIDINGEVQASIPLPLRAHGAAVRDGDPRAVLPARRPGTAAFVIDVRHGRLLQTLSSPAGRHFFGHAAFSGDGKYVFTTENDFEIGNGVVGVWDSTTWQRVTEFPSGGIGPHEVILLPDGKTLAIANGGILTHPDTGRVKHNLPTMQPSLAYIDSGSGRLLANERLPVALHQLSIRHLTAPADSTVLTAMQYQGARADRVPLLAGHDRAVPLTTRHAPPDIERRMRQYCGSITADSTGQTLMVSHPRGNSVSLWSGAGQYRESVAIRDCSGVAATGIGGTFLLAAGTGGIARYTAGAGGLHWLSAPDRAAWRWDNHLVPVVL